MPNINISQKPKKRINWEDVWSILAILALAALAFRGLTTFVDAAQAIKVVLGVIFVAMLVKLALKA